LLKDDILILLPQGAVLFLSCCFVRCCFCCFVELFVPCCWARRA